MELRIGDSATEVALKLVDHFSQVETFYFTNYSPAPGLEERLGDGGDQYLKVIFEKARLMRATAGPALPYWESIIATSSSEPSFSLFAQEALRHADDPQPRYGVNRVDLDSKKLEELLRRLPVGNALAFCSICTKIDGTTAYIPLMDFRVSPSPENLDKIDIIIRKIGIPGAVLKSGKSYHFFGTQLLDSNGILRFLGKCLLISPVTDSRYIGHRMIEGSCDLRISTADRKQTLPKVERIF